MFVETPQHMVLLWPVYTSNIFCHFLILMDVNNLLTGEQ